MRNFGERIKNYLHQLFWSQKRPFNGWYIFFLFFFISFGIYGLSFFRRIDHRVAFPMAGDFWNHVHMIQAFFESFKSGQWIPRTVVFDTAFYDFTAATFDSPTFQFYAFLEGLLALPLMLMRMDALTATLLVVIIARAFAGFWIFLTIENFGWKKSAGVFAGIGYISSPYLISSFYGRGAIAEVLAHSVLPLIPLSFSHFENEKWKQGIFCFAMATLGLVLSHNIFLLYGGLFVAVWILTRIVIRFSMRFLIASIWGGIAGLLLTSWQWLPISLYSSKLGLFGGLQNWKIGARSQMHVASLNGMWNFFPQPFWPESLAEPTSLFLTLPIWTLSVLISAMLMFILKFRKDSTFKWKFWASLFVPAAFFFALTFHPTNEFLFNNVLLEIFSIVQDTYRLISFSSLAFSLAIGLVIYSFSFFELSKFKSAVFFSAFLVLFGSSVHPILERAKLDFAKASKLDVEGHLRTFPINAYFFKSDFGPVIKGGLSDLRPDHVFQTPEKEGDYHLNLSGIILRKDSSPTFHYRLNSLVFDLEGKKWIQAVPAPQAWIEGKSGKVDLRLTRSQDKMGRALGFQIEFLEKDAVFYIYSAIIRRGDFFVSTEDIKRETPSGYQRIFSMDANRPTKSLGQEYRIELPIACGPLWRFTQNGKEMNALCDYNYRAVIWSPDLETPIIANYHWSSAAWILSLIGLLLLAGLMFPRFPFRNP